MLVAADGDGAVLGEASIPGEVPFADCHADVACRKAAGADEFHMRHFIEGGGVRQPADVQFGVRQELAAHRPRVGRLRVRVVLPRLRRPDAVRHARRQRRGKGIVREAHRHVLPCLVAHLVSVEEAVDGRAAASDNRVVGFSALAAVADERAVYECAGREDPLLVLRISAVVGRDERVDDSPGRRRQRRVRRRVAEEHGVGDEVSRAKDLVGRNVPLESAVDNLVN